MANAPTMATTVKEWWATTWTAPGPSFRTNSDRMSQHGGNHHGQKFLTLKTGAHALVTLAVDALQQEELATGAAKPIRKKPANG